MGCAVYVRQESGIFYGHRQGAEHLQSGGAALSLPTLSQPVSGQAGVQSGGRVAGPFPLAPKADAGRGGVPCLSGAPELFGPAAGQRPAGSAEREAACPPHRRIPLAWFHPTARCAAPVHQAILRRAGGPP